MRRLLALLPLAAVLAGVAAAAPAPAPLPRQVPPFPFAKLVRGLAALGDATPTSAVWLQARHEAAVTVTMGDRVMSNQPVYVAVVTGRFTANDTPRPSGTPAPTGTVATFIWDARTMRDTDFGLSNRYPDLNLLGHPHDFLPYLAQTAATGVPAQIETQWLERLSAGERLGCRLRFRTYTEHLVAGRLARAAAADGFSVVSLQFLHACQAAPLVKLTATDPHRFVRQLPALMRALDERTHGKQTLRAFEGFYLEASETSGTPFVVIWNHARGEVAGGQWASSPDLYPFPHG